MKKKRRIYFIEKEFQAKFILKFCGLVVMGGLLTILILYILAGQATTVSIVNSRVVVKSTADFILPLLIQTVVSVMVAVGLATVLVTLFVSHKIAGPLYRFKKVMQVLSGGDFSDDFKIRQLDQLQDVADTFNKMIVRNREELKSLKDSISSLKEELDKTGLSEPKKIIAQLQDKINNFKT